MKVCDNQVRNIGLSHRLGHEVEEKEKMCYESELKR